MNPLRALIWKEGREAIYKIAVGACLALFVGLAHNNSDFSLGLVSALVGLFGAVLMAMDAVAGERSRGTLPFLFIRPLDRGRLLGVKFVVGAVGLLVVLAAYWAGVYLGMPEWGNPQFLWGLFREPVTSFPLHWKAILVDVGYGRILRLWFLFYLIPYSAVFLASAFSDRSAKAAIVGLMMVWVGLLLLGMVSGLFPASWYYLSLVFHTVLEREAGILRQAFDPSLLLARVAGVALLAAGVLLWACRAFGMQESRRFQWAVGAPALIAGGIVIWLNATQSHYSPEPVGPVGRLPYEVPVVDMVLQDRLAVVLLERGVSVVDVADWRAPRESGRAKIKGWQLWRLTLSGSTAYVWGSSVAQDSVGVAVFDLSQPERPQLRAQRFLYPIGARDLFSQKPTPRLVGWAAWDGYLYAGLLGNESLELHSFDVREGGLPQPVHVLPIAEQNKHVWNNNWEMRLVGPHAFLTLGHDFVVLDLTNPRRPEELSRTPLRRFGPSKQYEESIEQLNHQLNPGAWLPDSVSFQVGLKESSWGLEALEMRQYGTHGEHIYRIPVPPGLGPISLSGDKAYVQRYWPQELAVLDIGDLRRPVEVDYVPNEFFPSGLTMDGDWAYALIRNRIRAYAVAKYGALWRRETLGLAEEEKGPRIPNFIDRSRFLPADPIPQVPASNDLILAGDHICAILRKDFVVFEALQDD